MYYVTCTCHTIVAVAFVLIMQLHTLSSQGQKLTYLQIMHQFKQSNQPIRRIASAELAPQGLQIQKTAVRGCPKQIHMGNPQVNPQPCKKISTIKCDKNSPYRTIDGTCNNLRDPELGKSFIPQRRFLPPAYADGMGSPRTRSVDGGALPSPRLVSNIVFTQKDNNEDRKLTLLVMSWGQFTEHDVLFTPADTSDANGNLITCCDKKKPPFPEPCFPIRIPANDPFFRTKCMEFIRSTAVVDNNCPCEPRQQMNELTSYIDASNVYGSTQEEVDKLRSFKDGLMLVSAGDLLPPRANQLSCILTEPGNFCFLGGDRRLHEVPTLASMHVTFVRYHNYLARQFKKINPHWNDERIFQETRKIMGAVMQKINLQEYLPAILNYDIRRKYCLTTECQKYDDKVDPATVNSFAATAFRFGHSQIAGMNALLKLIKSKSKCPYSYGYNSYTRKRCPMSEIIETERVPTESTFQNPKLVFDNVDGLQLFQVTNASLKADGEFDDSIRNKLFLDADNNSLDLGALDIQRGRDHGIPGYTEFRKFCGLSPVKHFRDLVDHSPRNKKLLRKAYRDVRDIDLFVGGQTEEHLPHSVLGPVFSCLIAEQYKRYKIGDRFWWERPDPVVGFTRGQRRAINKLRLSKIMCEMHNLSEIQPYVMLLPNQKWNRRSTCRSLPSLDLRAWRESGSHSIYTVLV